MAQCQRRIRMKHESEAEAVQCTREARPGESYCPRCAAGQRRRAATETKHAGYSTRDQHVRALRAVWLEAAQQCPHCRPLWEIYRAAQQRAESQGS